MLPFAQTQDGWTIVFLMALALTVAVLLMRSHRYLARQRREDAGTSPPASTLQRGPARGGSYTAAPSQVANWEVHMHETARDLMGQLDSKMRALQALTAEADRAADRLEAAIDQAADPAAAPKAETEPSTPQQPDASPPNSPADPQRRDEISMLSNYGYDAIEIARRTRLPADEVERLLALRKER